MTMLEYALCLIVLATNMIWFVKYNKAQDRSLHFAGLWQKECIARLDDFLKEHGHDYKSDGTVQ